MWTVELCMGTSCHLMGFQDLVAVLETLPAEPRPQLAIKEITRNKNSGKSPNIRINGELISNATPDRMLEILQANLT